MSIQLLVSYTKVIQPANTIIFFVHEMYANLSTLEILLFLCCQLFLPGSEYQELQEPALADIAHIQQPTSTAADGDTAAEQPHGAVVSHAFPHAHCVCLSLRLQGMVFQPSHRDG